MSSMIDRIKREYASNPSQNAIVDGQWSAFQMQRIRTQAQQRREDIRMIMLEKMGYTPESYALKMQTEEAKRRFEVLLLTKKKKD